METKVMITTIDNPYNPFTDYDNWLAFDIEKGYYTCSKLARISNVTDDMTDKEMIEEEERAINRLIEIDPLDIYIKVNKGETKDRGGGVKIGTPSCIAAVFGFSPEVYF